MYYIKLTKIKSDHKNLRTEEVTGYAPDRPSVGESFLMFGEALDPKIRAMPDGGRMVSTTAIVELKRDGDTFEFTTKNSVYKLELLGEGASKE